jgi:hypothetical protein
MTANSNQFGVSLRVEAGDIVVEPDGTLATISGLPNLLQALELRILTPFSSDMFNTSYGLDVRQAFTEPGSVRMIKELIKLNLVRTLGSDPRVRDVREVVFVDEPRFLERHPELDPAAVRHEQRQRCWRVEVIIDTIDGQTATLAAAIGA